MAPSFAALVAFEFGRKRPRGRKGNKTGAGVEMFFMWELRQDLTTRKRLPVTCSYKTRLIPSHCGARRHIKTQPTKSSPWVRSR